MGSPPRVLPSPPPPAVQPVGDGSAWSYTRQMYRSSLSHLCVNTRMHLHTASGLLDQQQELRHLSHVQGHIHPWLSTLDQVHQVHQMEVEELAHSLTQPRTEQPISKNKSPLPKLNVKGGDPTTLTRVINEWLQKTAIALNTWSLEASNFWNQSVNSARQQHNWWLSLAPQDRATHIGLPTSFQALPTQVPVLEATMRAELINSVLPEKVTSMAMQKGALKVHELLFLTFQAFLPSEPSARVDGLNTVKTPLKAARNFAEALATLRTWRQQVVTVVTDLKANLEPLKFV